MTTTAARVSVVCALCTSTVLHTVRLSAVLQPDIDRDIMLFEDDVRSFLESEIVKRYYFQRGVCQYNMRRDRCLDKAVEYLGDEERWNAIFEVERQGEEETD